MVDQHRLMTRVLNPLINSLSSIFDSEPDISFRLRSSGGAGTYEKDVRFQSKGTKPLEIVKEKIRKEEWGEKELKAHLKEAYTDVLDYSMVHLKEEAIEEILSSAEDLEERYPKIGFYDYISEYENNSQRIRINSNKDSELDKQRFQIFDLREGKEKLAEFTGWKELILPKGRFKLTGVLGNQGKGKEFNSADIEEVEIEFNSSPLEGTKTPSKDQQPKETEKNGQNPPRYQQIAEKKRKPQNDLDTLEKIERSDKGSGWGKIAIILLVLAIGFGVIFYAYPNSMAAIHFSYNNSINDSEFNTNNSALERPKNNISTLFTEIINASKNAIKTIGDDLNSKEYTDKELEKETAKQVHKKVNEFRIQKGLNSLQWDEDLSNIAKAHSDSMARRHTVTHSSPDGGGFYDRYQEQGYGCAIKTRGLIQQGAENVAKTYFEEPLEGGNIHESPKEVAIGIVEQWKESQGHRENMVKPYWQNEGIGVAVVEERDNTAIYATQNFC